MKKSYESPKAYVEEFTPNEYVAACGTEYGNYLFECDAPGGTLYYYTTNWQGDKIAKRLGGYHPCNKKHEAAKDSEFPAGFVDRNGNGKEDPGEATIVWLEKYYGFTVDYHATNNLDRDSWETDKS